MREILRFLKNIIAGFFTGIFFALPLGPVGIESIKRTLNKGLKEGIEVAFGAVFADTLDIILINMGFFGLFEDKKLESVFFMLCGILILLFTFLDKKKENKSFLEYDSLPFLKGFMLAMLNPMNHSFWIMVSGTIIQQFRKEYFIYYLISIISGMAAWFVILNILALKGITRFIDTNYKTSSIIENIMIVIGVLFFIYGLFLTIKYFI